MEERNIFKQDLFGLRTLKNINRLFQYVMPGFSHGRFINDKSFLENYILQYLN
jgi:hypothetical protein